MTAKSPWKTLSNLMEDSLNLDEVQDVLFTLHIDKDNLPRTKNAAIRELVETTYRNRRLTELISYLNEIRPNVDWPSAESLVHAKRPKEILPSSTDTSWLLPTIIAIVIVIGVVSLLTQRLPDIFNPRLSLNSEPTTAVAEIVEEISTANSTPSFENTITSTAVVMFTPTEALPPIDTNLTKEANSFVELTMNLAGDEIEKGTVEGYQAAVIIFNDAIEQRPDIARLHYELGRAYYNIATKQVSAEERIEIFSTSVLESLTDAINLDSSDAKAFKLRGRAFINIKNYSEAVTDFEKVIGLDNNDIEAKIFLGQAFVGDNRNEDAIALFTSLIDIESESGELYCWRGAAYSKNRDFDQAQADFDAAIDLIVDSGSACDLEEELQLLQERKAD